MRGAEHQEQREVVDLEGNLDRVKFAGEAGFVIGVLWTGKERVTVKGTLPEGLGAGDDLKLSGSWSTHEKWGKQFDFVAASPAVPKAAAGIRKWLAKWIDGIGDRAAEILVDRFGVEAPKLLEQVPSTTDDPLVDVLGDAEKAAAARASYAALGANPEQSRWLAEHGVVGAFAGRLVARYKGETRTVLEADPYLPMWEVDGFGWKRSDELAKALGVADHDPRRARAAVMHGFELAAGAGHVWQGADELEVLLAKECAVPLEATRDAIAQLLAEGKVVLEGTKVPRLYAASLRDAEVALCYDALRLLAAARALPALPHVRDERLNDEQNLACQLAATNGVVIVTGGPGTGKSHTLRAIVDLLDPSRSSTLLMAPTGKAAKRMSLATGMEASTIHRALEFGPSPASNRVGFKRHRTHQLLQRVVVVDEASMLDTELLPALLEAVQSGSRLVLVGDVDQLPSVGPGTVLKDLLESELVPVVRLVQNMRSKEGGAIATAAHKVIRGERLGDDDFAGDVSLLEVEEAETAAAEVVRLASGGVSGYAAGQVQVLCPKRVGPLGAAKLNPAIQAALNKSAGGVEVGETTFKVGDRVLATKNDYDLEVFNGDTGVVVEISPPGARERLVVVRVQDGAMADARDVEFRRDHLRHLALAYALTVHKSQGSEYPVVVIPVHTSDSFMLQRNLFYTALTRAREKVFIVGQRKAVARAVRNVDPMMRNTSLWARIRYLASKANVDVAQGREGSA